MTTLEELDQRLTARLDSLTASIEALTQQVGIMTENLTRLELQMERIADSAQLQAATSREQSANVAALIRLVADQQVTINRLLERVTR